MQEKSPTKQHHPHTQLLTALQTSWTNLFKLTAQWFTNLLNRNSWLQKIYDESGILAVNVFTVSSLQPTNQEPRHVDWTSQINPSVLIVANITCQSHVTETTRCTSSTPATHYMSWTMNINCMPDVPHTLQRAGECPQNRPFPPPPTLHMVPWAWAHPCHSQTASWLVQPLLQGTRLWPTHSDRHTGQTTGSDWPVCLFEWKIG